MIYYKLLIFCYITHKNTPKYAFYVYIRKNNHKNIKLKQQQITEKYIDF